MFVVTNIISYIVIKSVPPSGGFMLRTSDCHQTNKQTNRSVTSRKNRAQTQLRISCDHGNRVNKQTRFLVNEQLDAKFFSMYLFQFSTCFEQPRAHHQENQLYQYNIRYMSLCVGDRFVCRSETCTRNGHS